jgi:hypothetical protein
MPSTTLAHAGQSGKLTGGPRPHVDQVLAQRLRRRANRRGLGIYRYLALYDAWLANWSR